VNESTNHAFALLANPQPRARRGRYAVAPPLIRGSRIARVIETAGSTTQRLRFP